MEKNECITKQCGFDCDITGYTACAKEREKSIG